MAWQGVWSYKVDGVELNDGVKFIAMVPEVDNVTPQQVVLAPRDGDYPVFIRSQPQAGNFTILIAVKSAAMGMNAGNPEWQARIAELKTLFSPDQYHTLSVKVRGMSNYKSVKFVVESMQADFRSKTVVVSTVAPNPTLT
jgi:hypothetical protein